MYNPATRHTHLLAPYCYGHWAIGLLCLFLCSGPMPAHAQFGWQWAYPQIGGDDWNAVACAGDTCWLAGNTGALRYSTDGGQNWRPQQTGYRANAQAIALRNGRNAWMVADSGQAFSTTDGGTTWKRHWNLITGEPLNTVYIGPENRVMIAGKQGTLCYTDDEGKSWKYAEIDSQIRGQRHSLTTIAFSKPGIGCLGTASGHILITTDSAKTWRVITRFPQAIHHIAFRDTSFGMAVGAFGFRARTTDGGRTWIGGVDLTSNSYQQVAFHPGGKALLVGGFFGALYNSTNGGINWRNQSNDSCVWYKAAAFCNDSVAILTGTNGVIRRSTDGGSSWRSVNSACQTDFRALYFVNDSLGYAGGAAGILARSRNGGRSWQPLPPLPNRTIHALHFRTPAVGFALSRGVYVTADSGLTWNPIMADTTIADSSLMNQQWYSIDFPTPALGWIVGDSGQVLRTIDGGQSWERYSPRFTDKTLNSISFATPAIGVAVGLYDTYFATADSGKTWQSFISGAPVPLVAEMADEIRGFSVGFRGTISRTIDGGKSWLNVRQQGKERLQALQVLSPDVILAAGQDVEARLPTAKGVFVASYDGGANWQPVTLPTDVPIYALHFFDRNTGVIATSRGLLRFQSQFPVSQQEHALPERSAGRPVGFQVFPIPTADQLTVQSLLSHSIAAVMVNAQGTPVWQGMLTPLGQLTIDCQPFSSGIYLLQVGGETVRVWISR
jgi:photosystem II stability/assembly factor-like uncharacterized protein